MSFFCSRPRSRRPRECKSLSLPRLAWEPLVVSPLFLVFGQTCSVEEDLLSVLEDVSPLGYFKHKFTNHFWPWAGICCCVGFSPGGKGYSLLAMLGFSSRWRLLLRSPALGHVASIAAHGLHSTGSVAVALGLSCSSARGIFLGQGSMNSFKRSPALAGRRFTTEPPGKSLPWGVTDALLMTSLGSGSGGGKPRK